MDFTDLRTPFLKLFWADGESLGEIRQWEAYSENSQFFYCYSCDAIWGKIEYPNRHFQLVHLCCRKHRDERSEWYLPGSLLSDWDELDGLPDAVIRREFQIHLEELERQNGETK